MRAAEITDEDSLEAWLETQPREVCVWIAARGAARVLPIYWREVVQNTSETDGELTALPVCRALLTASSFATAEEDAVKTRLVIAASVVYATVADAAYAPDAAAAAAAAYATATADSATARAATARAATFRAAATATATAAPAADAWWVEANGLRADHPLWPEGMPDEIADAWRATRQALPAPAEDRPDYQSFWLPWYQGLLDGTPAFPRALTEAVALIDEEDWKQGDLHVNNTVIPALMAEHTPSLTDAAPVDFTFDAFARVMRMVGIDDDTAHLRDPTLVAQFRDDCEELEDTLQDFRDYAHALGGGRNHAGVLVVNVDKVLKELRRTADQSHLRARYLIGLCRDLEAFSKEERAREELGTALAGKLDSGVALLQTVTRKHLAPAYTALLPLAQLAPDQVDQDQVVALYDDLIAWLESLPSDTLVALDEDGLSVFRDMVREAKDFRAAIAEASSDEFRAMLEDRFAVSVGGTGLAFGRFVERSAQAAGTADRVADGVVKNFRRARTLSDIIEAFQGLPPGGAG